MQEMILPVDKLSGYIKNIFDNEQLLQNIQVSGEVSNYTESAGNGYFVLKGVQSQISCTFFATDLRKYLPKNGDKCIAKGSVSYYKKLGKLSFNVTDIRPEGTGDLYLKFLQLKDRLEKEGLFDAIHKVTLPYYVGKLGVVTSRSGAVIHDIIRVARKKYGGVDIKLFNVRVQGEGAEKEIANGIKFMDSQGFDVIIVARGGGSAEDLAPFNSEAVARAVYDCKTPIVSAVGHETDFTLCDMAADVRAATPTQAADIAVMDAENISIYLLGIADGIYKNMVRKFNGCLLSVRSTYRLLTGNINGIINSASAKIGYGSGKIASGISSKLVAEEARLFNIISVIEAKNPLKVLKRGYAVVEDESGRTVSAAASLEAGQEIGIRFYDGKVKAKIEEVQS